MKELIPHLRPWILPGDIEVVKNALTEKSVCHWKYAESLIEILKKYTGFEKCFLYSSGTLALRAALLSLNLPQESAVGIPSFTCKGLLVSVLSAGYQPFILDCDNNGLLSAGELAKALSRSQIQAVVAVHQFGLINHEIEEFTSAIPVIEDCSHVPPKQYLKQSQAIFGSLEGTKLLGAGEGGYLLLNNADIGVRTNLELEARLSDVIAVLVLSQLKRLAENVAKRESIAKKYCDAIGLSQVTNGERIVWFRFLLRMDSLGSIIGLINNAAMEGITLRQPIMPYPLHKYLNEFKDKCPNTEKLWQSLVSIPLFPDLKTDEVDSIVNFLEREFSQGKKASVL